MTRGDGSQIEFHFSFAAPTIIPQGDGSVLFRPGKPQARLTPLQFAGATGLSRSSIYHYINSGTIPERFVVRSGHLKIFLLAEAVEWWHKHWQSERQISEPKENMSCNRSSSSKISS